MSALARCRTCGAGMRWGVTVDGARMPLDPEPAALGNVWIRPDGRLRVLSPEEAERGRAAGHELFMPHHATCPGAGRHRVSRAQMTLGD